MEAAVRLIDGPLDKVLASNANRRREEFEEWLANALKGGARAAHRFISQDCAAPPLQLTVQKWVNEKRIVVSDPDEVAESYASPWRKEWGCDRDGEAREEVALLDRRRKSLREEAREYADGVDLGPATLRTALGTFKSNTSIGVDEVIFECTGRLPDSALQPLGDILRETVVKLCIPRGLS